MKKQRDVMIDLETLGTQPGCTILSIGAVAFDEDGLGPEFYCVVDRNDCKKYGLREDAATLEWWQGKSEAARAVLIEAESPRAHELLFALDMLSAFLCQFNLEKVRLWGNGSDFDNAILAYCYTSMGRPTPWNFWNNRCYRTLKNLIDTIPPQRTGVHHNALDDAKTQALHAISILSSLPADLRGMDLAKPVQLEAPE